MFFTISLFLLVLFWFNNFLDTAATYKDDSELKQSKEAAANIARIANTACILGENVTVNSPCVFRDGKPKPQLAKFREKTIAFGNATAKTACTLKETSFIVPDCQTKLCISGNRGTAEISKGACA